MPRDWRTPLALEQATLVLEQMSGDWTRYRRLPVAYRERLIATRRVSRMAEHARWYDDQTRRKLRDGK